MWHQTLIIAVQYGQKFTIWSWCRIAVVGTRFGPGAGYGESRWIAGKTEDISNARSQQVRMFGISPAAQEQVGNDLVAIHGRSEFVVTFSKEDANLIDSENALDSNDVVESSRD